MKVKVSRGRGRGVFATTEIRRGAIFHRCPVVIFHESEVGKGIENYVFGWDTDRLALALGYGSLFNHSESPNAEYLLEADNKLPEIYFKARKNIRVGEEIFIDYGP